MHALDAQQDPIAAVLERLFGALRAFRVTRVLTAAALAFQPVLYVYQVRIRSHLGQILHLVVPSVLQGFMELGQG